MGQERQLDLASGKLLRSGGWMRGIEMKEGMVRPGLSAKKLLDFVSSFFFLASNCKPGHKGILA